MNLISEISIGLTLGGISAITSTISHVYDVLTKLSSLETNEGVIKQIEELDIKFLIQVFELFVNELKNLSESQKLCLDEIHSIILSIKDELNKINERIEYNKSLYVLVKFRSYRFQNCIKRLTSHIKVFEKRCKMLFDITHSLYRT